MTINELRIKLSEIADKMKVVVEAMKDENLSDDDFTKYEADYTALETEATAVKEKIEAEEKKEEDKLLREARLKEIQDNLKKPIKDPPITGPIVEVIDPEEFKSLDDFLDSALSLVIHKVSDNRLTKYYSDTMNNPEFRDQSMGEATAGGYMVPQKWVPELKQLAIQDAIVRPRADVIAAGSPPDAEVTIPVGNQESYINMGVDVVWVGEGKAKTETEFALKEHSWIPHEVAGYITLTDKMIRNWGAAVSFTKVRLSKAIMQAEDTAFLTGNGVAKPRGIMNQNSRILQTRATTNTIAWADIRDMYWQCYKPGGSPIWIFSPTCLPQLMGISDPNTSGTMIWQPSAREGEPNRLLGLPMIENVRSPSMGSQGDLMLVNLSYYIIKDGSGPFIAASPHVYFTSNRTVVKIFWNVDGDSWLQAPIPIEGDSANDLSPFIILDE